MTSTEKLSQKFNSDNKKAIRTFWAKPFLSFLTNVLDKKLIYLGLPDVEAHDITEWLEYIDEVYAFQCRNYPKPSSPNQSREKILALEDTLRKLERTRKISTFDVFDGFIEEVLVRGYDNSPTIKDYYQQDAITLYNLDFCGQVTSPIEYKDRQGKFKKAYKFNAIHQLLNFQKQIEFPSKKFVMFLTLHCSYDGQEFENFLNDPKDTSIEEYIKPLKHLKQGKKAPYLIKAFVYDQMIKFFASHNFSPEFLPTIFYNGDSGAPLLFFTIVGTQIEDSDILPLPLPTMGELLNTPFISVNGEEFNVNRKMRLASERKLDGVVESVNVFSETVTYQRNWKKSNA